MDEQKIINSALRYVLDLLDPINHYPYHNINHTLDVYARVWYLCDKENIVGEDKTDLLLAALFHDTGFTRQYANNESISADIARCYLKNINFAPERIRKVERLIGATVLFSEAHDTPEGIMQDADLDNLGRKDYFVKSLLVRKELSVINHIDIPKRKWLDLTYNLMRNYHYKTSTAQGERDALRLRNIAKLEQKIAL